MKSKVSLSIALIFFFLSAIATTVAAANQEMLFEQANEAYSRGAYDQAIGFYETIVVNQGYSAPLLYNLANSYAQQGAVGKAVLNFERAAILAPSNPDIAGNLAKVRKESGLFQQESTGIDRIFRLLKINQWSGLALGGLALLALFLLATIRFQFAKTTHYLVYLIGVLLLASGIVGTIARNQHLHPSVVTSNDAKLLISPFSSASPVGAISEGRLVYPQKKHGAYNLVEDETGRKGWLETTLMESVTQPARKTN